MKWSDDSPMAKHAHLTLQDRSIICVGLTQGCSFAQIAAELGKDPGTISKEIRRHRVAIETGSYGREFNPCALRRNCNKTALCKTCFNNTRKCSFCKECSKHCPDFVEEVCPKLSKPPYVCNGCKDKAKCTLRKYEYKPHEADKQYKEKLSDSRTGFAITPEELERINQIVSPLVKNGQSIHHIFMSNADVLIFSEKTTYNLLNAGAFDANKMDCPRIVRMRPRKKEANKKVDRHCYVGRTYADFMEFTAGNPEVPTVQMDSVIGRKGGKVLLTIFFPNCNLLLGFLHDNNTARSVLNVFNELYETLGRDVYCQLFPVILTDRGSEFSNPIPIERDENGELRSLVFYCDPGAPFQKGGIEVAHELVRRILPKNTSFDNLQQEDIDLMLSHINSYKRGQLNNRSANQVFSCLYGDDVLPKLNIREIDPNDIILSPKLLRK